MGLSDKTTSTKQKRGRLHKVWERIHNLTKIKNRNKVTDQPLNDDGQITTRQRNDLENRENVNEISGIDLSNSLHISATNAIDKKEKKKLKKHDNTLSNSDPTNKNCTLSDSDTEKHPQGVNTEHIYKIGHKEHHMVHSNGEDNCSNVMKKIVIAYNDICHGEIKKASEEFKDIALVRASESSKEIKDVVDAGRNICRGQFKTALKEFEETDLSIFSSCSETITNKFMYEANSNENKLVGDLSILPISKPVESHLLSNVLDKENDSFNRETKNVSSILNESDLLNGDVILNSATESVLVNEHALSSNYKKVVKDVALNCVDDEILNNELNINELNFEENHNSENVLTKLKNAYQDISHGNIRKASKELGDKDLLEACESSAGVKEIVDAGKDICHGKYKKAFIELEEASNEVLTESHSGVSDQTLNKEDVSFEQVSNINTVINENEIKSFETKCTNDIHVIADVYRNVTHGHVTQAAEEFNHEIQKNKSAKSLNKVKNIASTLKDAQQEHFHGIGKKLAVLLHAKQMLKVVHTTATITQKNSNDNVEDPTAQTSNEGDLNNNHHHHHAEVLKEIIQAGKDICHGDFEKAAEELDDTEIFGDHNPALVLKDVIEAGKDICHGDLAGAAHELDEAGLDASHNPARILKDVIAAGKDICHGDLEAAANELDDTGLVASHNPARLLNDAIKVGHDIRHGDLEAVEHDFDDANLDANHNPGRVLKDFIVATKDICHGDLKDATTELDDTGLFKSNNPIRTITDIILAGKDIRHGHVVRALKDLHDIQIPKSFNVVHMVKDIKDAVKLLTHGDFIGAINKLDDIPLIKANNPLRIVVDIVESAEDIYHGDIRHAAQELKDAGLNQPGSVVHTVLLILEAIQDIREGHVKEGEKIIIKALLEKFVVPLWAGLDTFHMFKHMFTGHFSKALSDIETATMRIHC